MFLQAFTNKGFTYYNYKGTYSIVLMPMPFIILQVFVDIGAPGRCSDGGIFANSDMGKGFVQNALNCLTSKEIDTVNGSIPYYAVADEAFLL